MKATVPAEDYKHNIEPCLAIAPNMGSCCRERRTL